MNRINFSTQINATPEKIWNVLWNDATYRKWTSVFSEGSHAVSDWKKGSSIKFLTPQGDGMFSIIEDLVPYETMSFKHLGMIKNGEAQPEDENTKKWAGAMEIYTLQPGNSGVDLKVELDIDETMAGYFSSTFPKALEIVKKIAEG